MIERREADKPAQITFTSDFHELVTGDLRPWHPVILSYDPFRIVPKGEPYVFGDPARPIVAFVQCRDDDPPVNVVLLSPGGIIQEPDRDPTGQGSMLKARILVPADAERMDVWFSYVSVSGVTFYDSDYGKNFTFRFPSRDVAVMSATLVSDPDTLRSTFAVRVAVIQAAEKVAVRVRILGEPKAPRNEVKLAKTDDADEQGRPIWSTDDVDVPYQSVVRFKVFYWIGGRRYKDDNSGNYYLAPQPEPEKIPPPPDELAKAALAWK